MHGGWTDAELTWATSCWRSPASGRRRPSPAAGRHHDPFGHGELREGTGFSTKYAPRAFGMSCHPSARGRAQYTHVCTSCVRDALSSGRSGCCVICPITACRCSGAYRKKGQTGYQSRPQAAAAMARLLAEANPERTFWLVGDSAYVNAATLQGRPANLQVIGPSDWEGGAVTRGPSRHGRAGRDAPQEGEDRLPTPKAMIEDVVTYPAGTPDDRLPADDAANCDSESIRDALWCRGCQARAGGGTAGARRTGPVAGRGVGRHRPECLGRGRCSREICRRVERGTDVLREQAVPRPSRSAGSGAKRQAWSGRTRWRGSSGR